MEKNITGFVKKIFFNPHIIILFFVFVKLLLHALTATGYGYYTDEYYFAVCSEFPACGYVDQPPFLPLLYWLIIKLSGKNFFILRMVPALAGAFSLFITGKMVLLLNGGRFSLVTALLTFLLAPTILRTGSMFCIPSFELFFMTLLLYFLCRICTGGSPKYWVQIGILFGFGILTKYTFLFFGVAMFCGVLLSSLRPHLKSPWFWIGVSLTFMLCLPHFLWQAGNGWVHLQWLSEMKTKQLSQNSPLYFILGQFFFMHPLFFPLWFCGLGSSFKNKAMPSLRFFGIFYILCFLILLLLKGKAYYLSSLYPVFLVLGSIYLEKKINKKNGIVLRPFILSFLLLAGLITLPVSVPVLPYPVLEKWSKVTIERFVSGYEVTSIMSDMQGWDEYIQSVEKVYKSLDYKQRQYTRIFTSTYAVASALNYKRDSCGLPFVLSGNNQYYCWGAGDYDGRSLIVISKYIREEDLNNLFETVKSVDCIKAPGNSRHGTPVYICENLRVSVPEFWEMFKYFG